MKKILIMAAIVAVVLSAGCVRQQKSNSYTIYFFVNETNEPLDGSVSLYKDVLGNTTNGNISVAKDSLYPGQIKLTGNYKGAPFEFNFDLTKESLQSDGPQGFYVSKSQVEELTFGTGSMDTAKMAREFFDKINANRAMYGLQPLKWSDKMANAARAYAENYLKNKGNYELSTSQILNDMKIFALSSNTLSWQTPQLAASDNFAVLAAEKLSTYSGTKESVLYKGYDAGAAGIYCEGKGCAASLFVAQEAYSETITIEQRFCSFRYIYWNSLPLNSAEVKIKVNASNAVDIYILKSADDFGSICVPKNPVDKVQLQKTYEKTLTAVKGYGIAFYAPNNVNVTYSLEFTP